MPNNGRYILCPYYMSEKNKSISCEDTFRIYPNAKSKNEWLSKYCEKDWKECPYAAGMEAMYKKAEEGADMEKMKAEHIIEVQKKELRKATSKIGRMDRKLAAKDKEIRELRNKNKYLEDKYIKGMGEVRKMKADIEKYAKSVSNMFQIYEGYFCYLLTVFGDGKFNYADYKSWCQGKEFAIKGEKDKDGITEYTAIVREVNHDGRDEDLQEKEKELDE